MDDFTRGAPELRFRVPNRGAAENPFLRAFTPDGADAGLHFFTEGELLGFLLLELPRPVAVRRADNALVFTIHLQAFLGTRGHLSDASGLVISRLRRSKREYFAVDESGVELTRFTEAAEDVLTGAHGELIVRDVPIDGEAVSAKFATNDARVRATMLGLIIFYDYINH